jgi:hypothetical protein
MRLPGMRFRVEGIIVVAAMALLATLDGAYYTAYAANWVGKAKRGLAAWGNRGSPVYEKSDTLFDITFQNVASLSAILLSVWAARRISQGRFGGLIVAVFIILPLVLLSILCLYPMLGVIMGDPAPNG